MELNPYNVTILVALVLGVILFYMGNDLRNTMTVAERTRADMYRKYSYVLFAIAAGMAIYCYYMKNNKSRKGKMSHGKRAYMCGLRHM